MQICNGSFRKSILLLLSLGFALSCSKQKDFQEPSSNAPFDEHREPFQSVNEFPFVPPRDFFEQASYAANEVKLFFQVIDETGKIISDVTAQDVALTQNQVEVSNFEVSSADVKGRAIQIIFVVDITSGMTSLIKSLSSQIFDFSKVLEQAGLSPTYCLVTFKDKTEQKCQSFVLDNPSTSVNESLEALVKDLGNLKPSGGGDKEENPLRALMDASLAPWSHGVQRVAFLLTDQGFHYKPRKEGDAGAQAPTYEEALRSVMTQQMMVYAIAPEKSGYNQDFESFPSLTSALMGKFYSVKDFGSNKVKMASVGQDLARKMTSYYELSFFAEDNPGSDPTLPLTQRGFSLQIKDAPNWKVIFGNRSSTWPDGRPAYQLRWPLSDEYRETGAFSVQVDGLDVVDGVRIEENYLIFNEPPAPAARIEVVYQPKKFSNHMNVRPIYYPEELSAESLRVTLNGILVSFEELQLARDPQGRYVFDPAVLIFGFSDRFRIYQSGGLVVESVGEKVYYP